MTGDWRRELVDSNPGLFVRTIRGVPFAPGCPICGNGWKELVERLVKRVASVSSHYPVQFTQIAEYQGSLRVHWTARSELPKTVEVALAEVVARAEARSACTCSDCGAAGRLFSDGVHLFTACNIHQRGISVPAVRGFHDVYLIRALHGEKSSLVSRRYDRASDTFVEVN
jgi:hypothetical protein